MNFEQLRLHNLKLRMELAKLSGAIEHLVQILDEAGAEGLTQHITRQSCEALAVAQETFIEEMREEH